MNRGIIVVLTGFICLLHLSCKQISEPSPYGPVPNEMQLK